MWRIPIKYNFNLRWKNHTLPCYIWIFICFNNLYILSENMKDDVLKDKVVKSCLNNLTTRIMSENQLEHEVKI